MRLAISVLIAAVFLCGVSTAFTIPDQPAHKPGTPAGSAAATIAGSASSSVPTVTAAEAAPIKSSFPVIVEHSFVFPDLPSSHSAISLGAFTPRGSGSGSITLPSPSGGRFGSASLPALELSRAQAELLVPALQAEVAALAEDYPSKAEAPVGVDAPSSHASAKGGVVAQVAAPGPLYMLRVSDKSTGATATVSASLCHLLSSSLASPAVAGSSPGTGAGEGKESLVIDVTSFGTIAGAFYNVPPSPARPYLAGLCLQALSQLNRALASASASAADTVMRFGLTIRVRAPKDGGKPVTLGITEPMAPAAVAAATAGASSHPTSSDGKAAPEEEKSFLAKYWMYLVPFLLVSVASNLMAPADEPAESAAAEGGASGSDKQQSQGSTKKGPATKKA